MVPSEQWGPLESPDFPFSDYEYLQALEMSGSVSEAKGWQPHYLTLKDEVGLVAATPLYLKNHSYGEYIFDWEWARAYHQHGVPYYPKWAGAIPFTPATGPKLLVRKGADRRWAQRQLLEQLADLQNDSQYPAQSTHFLFITPEERPAFEEAGYFIRHSFQYHWKNRGYSSFEDFLEALKGRKAKQIRKERAVLSKTDIKIEWITGADLTPEHAKFMANCYLSTIGKMGAIAYLNEEFFQIVFRSMPDRVALCLASQSGQKMAASLFYLKGNSLYGRYWGSVEEAKHLHFELCYYQGIERAIAKGLSHFEAGAQGEHKHARGFLPSLTLSAHNISHPQFRTAIGSFITQEALAIQERFDEWKAHSPYREIQSWGD